ncbi:hypothetical protein PLICBS_000257 [Purpureocillium lilacinum]|uniref:uncharacterized protein n=1 Tax=Purpureocillium lilacinum TaxID=33203 RepID=UPI0020804D05|nr:hypothetical protein PLICBS_000257 [Purpureocillium lilacinum]
MRVIQLTNEVMNTQIPAPSEFHVLSFSRNDESTLTSTLFLSGISCALKVTIVGDTNRDGIVDTTGDADLKGRDTWTDQAGAIFLANIGDTNRRCSSKVRGVKSLIAMLDTCNDASGNEQRNPKYLAPPRTLPVQGLSVEAVGSIRVTDEAVAQNERIFHRVGQGWIYASPNHIFTSEDLRKGLKLGVDARDVRRLGGWDGRATETSLRRMVDLASPDCSALEAMTESRI